VSAKTSYFCRAFEKALRNRLKLPETGKRNSIFGGRSK
jgi:hypothetical protein